MKNLIIAIVFLLLLTSCINDLNVSPIDPDELTSDKVFDTEEGTKQVLAKIYAGLSVTGQKGPVGDQDVQGIDEGASSYLRQYWSLQELSTDEAVIAWGDVGIQDFHDMDWDANNKFINGLYAKIFFQISLANDLIKNSKGKGGKYDEYATEARFLRALSYYHALDLFGNVPFVTENDGIGATLPKQTNRVELYNYILSELNDIKEKLPDRGSSEYGRADKGAVKFLLAKLYLNANVYIGEKKYTECITELKDIIAMGYTLESNYQHLFLADNHQSDNTESIFLIEFDGDNLRSWGGTTFLANASYGDPLKAAEFGLAGWGGIRSTKALVDKFRTTTTANSPLTDNRGKGIILVGHEGFQEDIDNISNYKEGWPVTKYRNIKRDNTKGKNNNHPDIDFIMFRLADAYLMYAECVLRGGTGGDRATALQYVNNLRQRDSNIDNSYVTTGGDVVTSNMGNNESADDIQDTELTLDFILDERARELYWEGHRRQDLIRFDKFVSDTYVWPWKGGAKAGKGVEEYRKLYPIPSSDLNANPNLKQNTGY